MDQALPVLAQVFDKSSAFNTNGTHYRNRIFGRLEAGYIKVPVNNLCIYI
jgi:hypothetical protein